MTANVDIDVTANSSDTDEGDITFTSTINDTDGTSPFSLTLDSDGGAIDVQGIIGGTNKVGAISINNTGGDGSVTLAGIGNASANSNAGAAGNEGLVNIGNTASASVNFGGGFYMTDGATVIKAKSEVLERILISQLLQL